jgi:hypothetical protein
MIEVAVANGKPVRIRRQLGARSTRALTRLMNENAAGAARGPQVVLEAMRVSAIASPSWRALASPTTGIILPPR